MPRVRTTLAYRIEVLFLLALATWLPCSPAALAVIIASGDGTGNTAAPPDDPGWEHVSRGSSAVYLGYRYVLTAAHIGPVGIVLNGQMRHPIAGSEVRIENPPELGLSQYTDLMVYQISTDPGLPDLEIAAQPVPIGQRVVMMGNGRNRVATATAWDVTMDGDDWIWSESPTGAGEFEGFLWADGRSKRWGENVVEDDEPLFEEGDAGHDVVIDVGFGDTVTLVTRFDADGLEHEAEAANNDSGGAVFTFDGQRWVLAGIMVAIGQYHDQPRPTAMYGNLTYFADLSVYRDQIMGTMSSIVPAPGALAIVLGGMSAVRRARKRA